MKLKTLAILAISGLFAITLAHANGPSKILTADDTAAMSGAGTSDAPASAPSDMPSNAPANTSGNVGASDGSNDDMSADTATGDDDY